MQDVEEENRRLEDANAYLRQNLLEDRDSPEIAIICGSGLDGVAEILSGAPREISYEYIPHFPKTTGN